MTNQELDDVKFAVAVLVASIVNTIGEDRPDLKLFFQNQLKEWVTALRENPGNFSIHALETLKWADETVRAKSPTELLADTSLFDRDH